MSCIACGASGHPLVLRMDSDLYCADQIGCAKRQKSRPSNPSENLFSGLSEPLT
jgi:hypothetical protein